MTLEQDIVARMNGSVLRARVNYFFAYLSLLVAVVASAWSSIAIATKKGEDVVNAALALVPGLVVVLMQTFKFDARAEWWWAKYHALDDLYRRVKYEGETEAQASAALTGFIKDHGTKWPGFGQPPQ